MYTKQELLDEAIKIASEAARGGSNNPSYALEEIYKSLKKIAEEDDFLEG